MKNKKDEEFEVDFNFIGCFIIGCISLFIAAFFGTFFGRIDNLNNEKECIEFYLNTGYILEECSNYENLKN